MRNWISWVAAAAIALSAGFAAPAAAQVDLDVLEAEGDAYDVLEAATNLLDEMETAGKDEEPLVPADVWNRAEGVAIFPEVNKIALGVGGSYAEGLLMRRFEAGGFSPPAFVDLYGGSVGGQLGATRSSLILIFMDAENVSDVLRSDLALGVDASVALGPYGARAEESTAADVLVYERTEGVFAGIDVSGSYIRPNEERNEAVYLEMDAADEPYFESALDIVHDRRVIGLPAQIRDLQEAIERHASGERPAED